MARFRTAIRIKFIRLHFASKRALAPILFYANCMARMVVVHGIWPRLFDCASNTAQRAPLARTAHADRWRPILIPIEILSNHWLSAVTAVYFSQKNSNPYAHIWPIAHVCQNLRVFHFTRARFVCWPLAQFTCRWEFRGPLHECEHFINPRSASIIMISIESIPFTCERTEIDLNRYGCMLMLSRSECIRSICSPSLSQHYYFLHIREQRARIRLNSARSFLDLDIWLATEITLCLWVCERESEMQ